MSAVGHAVQADPDAEGEQTELEADVGGGQPKQLAPIEIAPHVPPAAGLAADGPAPNEHVAEDGIPAQALHVDVDDPDLYGHVAHEPVEGEQDIQYGDVVDPRALLDVVSDEVYQSAGCTSVSASSKAQ